MSAQCARRAGICGQHPDSGVPWSMLCTSLTGLWGAHVFGQTVFWVSLRGVSGGDKCFHQERTADCSPSCGWAPSNQSKAFFSKQTDPLLSQRTLQQTVFRPPMNRQQHGVFGLPASSPQDLDLLVSITVCYSVISQAVTRLV